MKFENQDHKKQAMNEEIERLRLEIAGAYRELDMVKGQIADQRRGATIVFSEKKTNEEKLGDIISTFESIQKQLESANNNFYNLTEKQRQKIRELNQSIYKKVSELSEYEKKELIDIEGLNLKYKTSLEAIIRQIADEKLGLGQLEKKKLEFEKYLKEESQKLEKQRQYQKKYQNDLEKRELGIKIHEERLDALHLELKAKRNVKNMT